MSNRKNSNNTDGDDIIHFNIEWYKVRISTYILVVTWLILVDRN